MDAEGRARRWREAWERSRRRCLDPDAVPPEWLERLPREAIVILEEVRAVAGREDPAFHAALAVERFVDRVNGLGGPASLLLHGPVCNGLTMLRCAAQELLAAGSPPPAAPARRLAPSPREGEGRGGGEGPYRWLLVVGGDEVLEMLAQECAAALGRPLAVETAATLESALRSLGRLGRRGEAGIVLTNLTLRTGTGQGPWGLRVAAEARHRRDAVLVVTAASDYLGYWPRLAEAGLTGHDVVVKTRRDFSARLRRRLLEIALPTTLGVSYDEDTGHVMWIGDVEVTRLEGQEALVLRALDGDWRSPQAIADACGETALGPTPGSIPPLISTLRTRIAQALLEAESPAAQREVIQSRRREGQPTCYRLAPWLRWEDPPEPEGAAPVLPPVLVIEDDREWASWVAGWLDGHGWHVTVAETGGDVLAAIAGGEPPIVVADLAFQEPGTPVPDPAIGLRLIEEVALRRPGTRVVVLSAFGWRDTVRARLFEAGVRMIDVIDKAAGRDECAAVLLSSLQRAVEEGRRGVRKGRDRVPVHRVLRTAPRRIEVDGHAVDRLTEREAAVLDELIGRAGLPLKADYLEAACFPLGGRGRIRPEAVYNPLNKVHLTVSRLRRKIDVAVGEKGVGASVIRTPHMGARTTYALHGVVTDLCGGGGGGAG